MGTNGSTANGLSALGPQMGKAHGGGVKLDRKSPGKISQSQDDVLSGKETRMEDDSMAKSGVISGSFPKGGFMKHSKSYGHPKGGESKGDQSNTQKDYSMDKGNTDPNYKSKKDGESKGDQSTSDKDYSTAKSKKGPHKDYDGDGKQESSTQEYLGSVDKAINANKK